MKRTLTVVALFLALISSFSVPLAVIHAQNDTGTSDGVGPPTPTICDPVVGPCPEYSVPPSTTKNDVPDTGLPGGTLNDVEAWIMNRILSIFAWLLGVASITLDNAMYYTIVTMGNLVKNLSAIGVTWRILRDIGNILLIFGFLVIGISTIIDTNIYGWGKSLLPMLLIAAITLNFSLFISEAVIDASNLFATQFYTQINGGNPAQAVSYSNFSQEGISTKIMSQLKLQGVYSAALNDPKVFTTGTNLVIAFMGIILFIIAAFVMFSLAFMLISRFVILIFLIIVSPIGFAGLAVPKLKGLADDWWSQLFHQSISAPVLLLLLYIALAVITDAKFLSVFGGGEWGPNVPYTGFVNNVNLPAFASIILSFLVAMGLLLGVVIAARKIGAFGSEWAMKTAGKLSFGLVGAGMRSTVGWGSYRLSQRLKNSEKWQSRKSGRVLTNVLDRGAKQNWDVRSTKAFKNIPFGGVEAGKPQEGGYVKRREENIKKHEEYVKSIGKAIGEAGAEKLSQAQLERWNAEKEVKEGDKKMLEEYDALEEKINTGRKAVMKETQVIEDLQQELDSKHGVIDDEYKDISSRLSTAKDHLKQTQAELTDNQTKSSKMNSTEITRARSAAQVVDALSKTEKGIKKTIDTAEDMAKLRYAQNVKGFGGWVMFGRGHDTAAWKIIKDVTKTESAKDKIYKAVMEAQQSTSTPSPAAPPTGGTSQTP